MKVLKKVLIANRSEIALRIQATCHALGYQTVAIFSQEDRHASFVYSATEAFCLSQLGHMAYLAQDEIIQIALKAGVQAIHPGYGFLSENNLFAQKVIDAGLIWIGPDASCIAAMADKITARDMMQQAGVPVVPGFVITDGDSIKAKEQASHVGYPLIIKDPRGGGGKAMRRVMHEDEFDHALMSVLSEAKKLTGSTILLVEKYIQQGRHIEVQVAGDGKNFIHLFERECSIQRRHQKIIEETPCNFVSKEALEGMYQAALCAVRTVSYDNIGTVEFIVTPEGDFYFLEMNTRLQVEHAVTEMTTGVDLVALQIQLATKRNLPLSQNDITRSGHAIQCRVYAENPYEKFTPSSGTLQHLFLPANPFIRAEHDLAQGGAITPFFDPMIAKFVAYGSTRTESTARLVAFLDLAKIEGIKTNKSFLRSIMLSDEFVHGALHTQLIASKEFMNKMDSGDVQAAEDDLLAGIAVYLHEQQFQTKQPTSISSQMSCHEPSRRWKDQQWR